MPITEKKKIILTCLVLLFSVSSVRAVGQAAIPTVLLAPGARATGMGEAFVALSDDVDATFYNPGALGLQPLSNAWKTYGQKEGLFFKFLTGKKKLLFGERASLWGATVDNTLYKFDGSVWLSYEVYFLEQNDNIEKVVKKYMGFNDTLNAEDSLKLAAAVAEVRTFNEIVSPEDEELIPDFKIPFSIMLKGESIVTIAVDPSNRLWLSTKTALFSYATGRWKRYSEANGLPIAIVKTIFAGTDVWVGTDSGAAKLSKGEWSIFRTAEFTGTNEINVIMVDEGDAVWLGTPNGLIRRKGKSVTIYDSTNGLIDNDVRAFTTDAERNVWAATKHGVARYRLKAWKKFRMDGNEVFSIAADTRDYIWVSTKKGALRYYKGTPKIIEGKTEIEGAYWKHFHAKNGLPSDKIHVIVPQGRDVWVLTDKGIGRYDKAEKQFAAFYENLLPEFNLADLYHLNIAVTYPTEDWGTLGAFVKYISFGESDWTDEVGRILGTFRSYDMFFGVSYGTNFGNNLGVGITPKFIYSKLSDVPVGNENRKGISYSFGVDLGVKYRGLLKNLDVGVAFQNMGPDVVYIDQNQADPIPFNLRAGIAYSLLRTPVHDLKILFDVNRELVKRNDPDPPDPFWMALFTSLADDPWKQELAENVWSLGMEYWYSQFLAFRTGTMYDKAGSRGEWTVGLGINVTNFQFNLSYILGTPIIDKMIGGFFSDSETEKDATAFDTNGSARNGQLRLALNFLM
jgi:hypothetical protein